MTDQGDPHLPRLFTPGVAVVIGYVLLVGNPWTHQDLLRAVSGTTRFVVVMVSYPLWHVDADRVGPFLFWSANLRMVLFVALTVAGLIRMSRGISETASGVGLFVTTVGLTTLSAVAAGLASAVIGLSLLDPQTALKYSISGQSDLFLFSEFSRSASFGVLFGLMLGAVVVAQRRSPANRERRVSAPKSFW